jgi:hypothetical protein
VNRLIVNANDGLGAVAPEVTRCEMFTFLLRKGFLRCGAHVQAFGPQMLAKYLVHDVNFSV